MSALRLNHAGIERVDANLPRSEFPGQGFRYGVHRRFGSAVNRTARNRGGTGNRTYIDDGAGRTELLDCFLGSENQAENIQVELPVEMLLCNAFERKEFINAGVIHENVELAKGFPGLDEEAFDVRLLRNVRLNGNRLATLGRDFIDDLLRS